MSALNEFGLWIPGELEYSVRKAGYEKKIERAQRPVEDGQSMYSFLGTEWDNFRNLRELGEHYKPFHGMSAQLQLAKFAAGLIDKAALARWGQQDKPADVEVCVGIARTVGDEFVAERAWELYDTEELEEFLGARFDDTPFAEGVEMIMEAISNAQYTEAGLVAAACGGLAVASYGVYAQQDLAPDQLVLPISELAPKGDVHTKTP